MGSNHGPKRYQHFALPTELLSRNMFYLLYPIVNKFMEKINILFLGSCTAKDIVMSNSNWMDEYNFQGYFFGSISRSLSPPGSIAQRLAEETDKNKPTFRLVSDQINMITKKKNPMTLIENLPANTVILYDLAYELLNFFNNGLEMFDIHANYQNIKQFLPNWLRKDIFTHLKTFDSNSIEMAFKQYHTVVNFYKLCKSKNIPIIIFNNTYSYKTFDKNTNSVGEVYAFYNKKMPFDLSSFGSDEILKYKYSRRIIANFYNNLLDKFDHENLFTIPLDEVYADPDHHEGYHPVHYHHTCRITLRKSLQEKIAEVLSRSNEKKIIAVGG